MSTSDSFLRLAPSSTAEAETYLWPVFPALILYVFRQSCPRWLAASAGLLALLAACPAPAQAAPPSLHARFFALLAAGDSVYAEKKGYSSFAHAQQYYDRAQVLAERSQDTLLLAEAVFARGRVYDAWNKEPHKTVRYFQQAADLFARLPTQRRRYFYATYLVAHAYDKVPDSLRTVRVLRRLRRELRGQPEALLRQVPSTVEMALTATEVRNYALADSLLRQLVHRPWVRNDPETYDYLTHYYLAQARLDVHYRRRRAPYLDSLARMPATNALDRVYYGHNLADLYAAAGRSAAAYIALRRATHLADSLDHGGDLDRVRLSLLRSEEQAAQRQQQVEAVRQRARTWGLWGLGGGLTIISLLSFYLLRQQQLSRRRAQALARANAALAESNARLDQQVAQVELLNKEIQHRVKNNLHMVYSLLQMQERRTDNEEVIEHLQAARLRIESIAALHNQLLLSPAEGPDLAVYLKGLISSVVSCLANDRQVITHLQSSPLRLPPSAYLALSLILNEWVTNSIKYADTPPGQLLEISVRVRHESQHTCLEYADSGTPPVGTAPARPGLGNQIINLLTRQLGATLTTPPGKPYSYTLCLPILAHGA